jgi:valyl-tRNA synthetase
VVTHQAFNKPFDKSIHKLFDKPFDAQSIEPQLQKYWKTYSFFKAHPHPHKKPYTIVMPPPNITGDLTMGHVINHTLQDILIRWHRLKQKSLSY